MNKKQNFFEKIINSNIFNKMCFALGIILILIYFGFYFIKQPIVDEEVVAVNNFKPWIVSKDESFIKSMIEKPFDLKITEYGQYRPRYLAFLTQFLDENIFVIITRLIPFFGNRQPFYILAAFLTVLSFYYFLKNVCKSLPKGFSFFISSSILLFQNYQVATYWRARSAKLLAISATVFLISFVIKNIDFNFEKKDYKKLFLSIPLFLIMTLDEQVLALVAFLTLLSYIFILLNKKISLVSVINTISCFIYLTYHLWWGKAIFRHFTGLLQRHGHTISGSIKGISLHTLYESLKILKNVIPKIIFWYFIVFFIIWIVLFISFIVKKEPKKEKIKETIILLFLTFSSIILLMLMIDAHPAIYQTKSLWLSVYIIIPVLILFMSFLYLIEISDLKKYNYLKKYILFFGIFISLILNIKSINSTYYGAYLDVKGGFLDYISDIMVTENSIEVSGMHTNEYNIDNDDLIAILNTSNSTDNIKTTKILKGYKEGILYDKFEGYLITREERILYIDFNVDHSSEYEKVIIYVNNDKYEIDVDNRHVKKELNVSTERNRACKIKINIIGKKDNIKVNELYMK